MYIQKKELYLLYLTWNKPINNKNNWVLNIYEERKKKSWNSLNVRSDPDPLFRETDCRLACQIFTYFYIFKGLNAASGCTYKKKKNHGRGKVWNKSCWKWSNLQDQFFFQLSKKSDW